MNEQAKHVETPYTVCTVEMDRNQWAKLWNEENITIGKGADVLAIVYTPDHVKEKDQAEFMKRACNSHDALLEAAKLLLTDIDQMVQKTTGLEQLSWMRHAKAHRAAIALAEKGA